MNWKCNPSSLKEIKAIVSASDYANIIICPPAPFIGVVSGLLKNASLGAQNGHWAEGAYTGEYSFKQLKSIGVRYVIIGHSERRESFGETPEIVRKKISSALCAGVIPILCIGEKKRKSLSLAVNTVLRQMEESLIGIDKEEAKKIILAYEPVWAISSTTGGRKSSLAETEPVMIALAKKFEELFGVKAKVLYGGSVNPDNIAIYLNCESVYGALVGSASVDKNKVALIARIINNK